jgi:hypothetical protein
LPHRGFRLAGPRRGAAHGGRERRGSGRFRRALEARDGEGAGVESSAVSLHKRLFQPLLLQVAEHEDVGDPSFLIERQGVKA